MGIWSGLAPVLRPDHLLTEIIRPTLEGLEADSPEAEALLLGTALAESGLRALRQDGGPALGLWQMEPGTHQDIWNSFLMYRAELTRRLQSTCRMDAPFYPEQLVYNLRYACAMARVHYMRVAEALPEADDVEGQARYWKQHYNTPLGAGTIEHFMEAVG